jgi:hypothetical protein
MTWQEKGNYLSHVREDQTELSLNETRETGGTSETRWESNLSTRAFLACLALHAPRSVALAGFFSILLETV